MSSTLVIMLNIGDEDGPSYSYWYKDTIAIQPSHVLVTDISSNIKLEYIEDYYISDIVKKYNINDVLEIHDWYDNLAGDDLKDMQETMDELYLYPKLHFDTNREYILITAVFYNNIPSKYLIPIEDFRIFIEQMEDYEVTASYFDICN